MKTALKIFVIFLPVIIMGLLIASNIHNQKNGEQWRIPVTGYDPRDLLRGHYLTFRYDWNWRDKIQENKNERANCVGRECALCLQRSDEEITHIAYVDSVENARQCDSFIKGRSYNMNNFSISGGAYGLQRYYIPEKNARQLDQMLRQNDSNYDFEIEMRISDTGRAFIEGMYIDDQPLEEWIKVNAEISD